MPNTKTALKRMKTNLKREERNKAVKTRIKSSVKRFENALKADNKEEAQKFLNMAYRNIDKAVSKGILHKNNASRKKSRLSKLFNNKLAI
ncbi:MAG: 30S ribosomal protein S20 [Candidatus Syntrophonatronum acetioxidans]|uniref:Small ribosomal subunit protein bS20 n=1 Tax=Candidatus Syntrophonatronum acetioxidans TaxID=1795816 RepID=A0A424Y925_9FIRM|nr:MAG: 30S ribosomal protein S20 [Candidatus Syntrophonatronum acetioxidans]